MFDAAIIGTGPAGLSAALDLKLHGKSLIWFGQRTLSKKVERSERIANYPGFLPASGTALNALFARQAEEMGLTITDKLVTLAARTENGFQLLAENELYEARTLLLAIGAVTGKGLPGEQQLLGRGVSYCATCDGFLYRGKRIAVVCTDVRYEHEARYLAGLAGHTYFYPTYRDSAFTAQNVTRLLSPVAKILGEGRVRAVSLADGSEVAVDGVFLLRSAVAPASLLPGLELDGAHIAVGRSMETNLAGCFAAGDCTGRPYQIAKAVGEGCTAAHAMIDHLDKMP